MSGGKCDPTVWFEHGGGRGAGTQSSVLPGTTVKWFCDNCQQLFRNFISGIYCLENVL